MAWVFGIAAECGPDPQAAGALAAFFERAPGLPPGQRSRTFQDSEGNYWAHVWWPEIAPEAQPGVKAKLERLALSAPPFRYCLVGVETDEFRFFSELLEDLGQVHFGGLIVRADVYTAAGAPEGFEEVADGLMRERESKR